MGDGELPKLRISIIASSRMEVASLSLQGGYRYNGFQPTQPSPQEGRFWGLSIQDGDLQTPGNRPIGASVSVKTTANRTVGESEQRPGAG